MAAARKASRRAPKNRAEAKVDAEIDRALYRMRERERLTRESVNAQYAEITKLRAHPPTYDAKVGEEICKLTSIAWSLHEIGMIEGHPSKAGIQAWLSLGATGDERFVDFYDEFSRARQRAFPSRPRLTARRGRVRWKN